MSKWRPFSKRKKAAEGEAPTALEYENFPDEFRTKLDYHLQDALAALRSGNPFDRVDPNAAVQHELAKQHGDYSLERLSFSELLQVSKYLVVLDAIEIALLMLGGSQKIGYRLARQKIPGLVGDINDLFEEYGLGYEIHEGRIIVVESQAVAETSIKPALTLLSASGFEQANDEFGRSLENLKAGDFGEVIVWANASFESAMKVILEREDIPFDKSKDTARPLITKVLGIPGFLPPYLASYANNLTEVLQGLATFRNRNPPAHGQGTARAQPDRNDAQFALGFAGTLITYIVRRFEFRSR